VHETRQSRNVLFRVEVVGSTPADPTTRRTDPAAAKIFKALWVLKKAGYSEDTLKAKGHRLKYLAKHTNLDDPEAMKGYIANRANWSNASFQRKLLTCAGFSPSSNTF